MTISSYKYRALLNKNKKKIKKTKKGLLNPEQTNSLADHNPRKENPLQPTEFVQIDLLRDILEELKKLNNK